MKKENRDNIIGWSLMTLLSCAISIPLIVCGAVYWKEPIPFEISIFMIVAGSLLSPALFIVVWVWLAIEKFFERFDENLWEPW